MYLGVRTTEPVRVGSPSASAAASSAMREMAASRTMPRAPPGAGAVREALGEVQHAHPARAEQVEHAIATGDHAGVPRERGAVGPRTDLDVAAHDRTPGASSRVLAANLLPGLAHRFRGPFLGRL